MVSRMPISLLLLLFSLTISYAASSVSVPSDLSSGFKSDSIALQVSYTDQSDNGFADGTTFSTQQTSKAPVFALGDASGVNTLIKFVILMVDTTDTAKRVLHYIQTDFQATGTKTAIASSTQPKVPYKGPGTLGESGQRQYTFLMYQQKPGFSGIGLPSSGSAFDVKTFQSVNGLSSALAGNIMVVNIQSSSSASGTSSAVVSPAQSQAQTTAAIQSSFIQSEALTTTTTLRSTAFVSVTVQDQASVNATSSVTKVTQPTIGAGASPPLTTPAASDSAAVATAAAMPKASLENHGVLFVVAIAIALV